MSVPSAPPNAPTYTAISQTSVTLNNVPALSAGQIVVSGAGSSFVNGNYSVFGTLNGANSYKLNNNNFYIIYTGSQWAITNAPGTFGSTYYTAAGTASAVPASGWATSVGSAPAPTVSSANAATSINIQRALDVSGAPGTPTTAGTAVPPSTNFTDSTVQPSTTYWFRYGEVNSSGTTWGPWSSVKTLAATSPTGFIMSVVY